MKRIALFSILLLICGGIHTLQAQNTKGFSYQAVARDVNGAVLANSSVNLRFQIRDGSSIGPVSYQETHLLTTNDYGLFSTIIGKGTLEAGDFNTIAWGESDFFLVVELDGTGVDTALLEAVPYAKVATEMDLNTLRDVEAPTPGNGQVLKWNGSEWAPGIDGVFDGDSDPSNELQVITLNGNDLSISNGNTVTLPLSPTYTAGTGISISGSVITNAAPDQMVVLTGSGATSIGGSYPNFTISSTDNVNDGDTSITNEIQNLSITGSDVSISNGNTITLPAPPVYTAGTGIDVTGTTITNLAPDQTVVLTGTGATNVTGTYPNFTVNSTDLVDDADADATNEIQTLSLSGSSLSLGLGGGSVSLVPFESPWSEVGGNLYYNLGNVGIGDASPASSFTVGNGDKFQVSGTEGDVVFTDDQASIHFANANGANQPMMQMFQSGSNNSTRMVLAHSPSFPQYGIRYNDTADAFTWIGDNVPVMHMQLVGARRIGIGNDDPEAKLHVSNNSSTGFGQIKLTETQYGYSRITMDNSLFDDFWDIAARTDTNLTNAQYNVYHSSAGDIFSVNARGRIGINDPNPAYTVEINGNESTRIMNLYNTLPTTTSTTFNYGLRVNMTQAPNTGFPRLYNVYAITTDANAFLSYGVLGYADNASSFNYGVYGISAPATGYAVYASGNTYSTGSYLPSDTRLKTDIEPLPRGLSTILELSPKQYHYDTRKYDFMNLPQQLQYGFLAQDMETLLPELTKESFQAYDEALSDTKEGQGMHFTAINYMGLIPIMVAGMQEQNQVIEEQKQQISDLEARIERLERLIGE